MNKFHVVIREGGVLLTQPEWKTDSTDAEEYLHGTLGEAREDAEKQYRESVAAGWVPV